MGNTTTVEIRPGEGGAEAEAFASEVASAIAAFARREQAGHETERSPDGRTIRVRVSVPALRLSRLAGVHRIQRVPKNAKSGRRHTATASVVVIGASSSTSVEVDRSEVDIDVYRGSGPGGQHRNKTDSCVRLRHRPTGIVVVATESRSQHTNREVAFERLKVRLQDAAEERSHAALDATRRSQVSGSGREAKQWTWNQQRSEVVDHDTGRRWPMKDIIRGKFPAD